MSDTNTTEASPFGGKKRALIVGVNSAGKPSMQLSLRNAQGDAEDISSCLYEEECGFEFSGGALHGSEAEAKEVRERARKLINQSQSEDLLLFYFIGCLYVASTNGRDQISLVTDDFDPDDVADQPGAYLSLDWIRRTWLENERLGNVIVILDCCSIGDALSPLSPHERVIQSTEAFLQELGPHQAAGAPQEVQTRMWAVIVSIEAHERIHKSNSHMHLTSLLLDLLKGNDLTRLDQEGKLTLSALCDYLERKIPGSEAQRLMIKRTFAPESRWSLLQKQIMKRQSDFLPRLSDNADDSPHVLAHRYFDALICQEATDADLDEEQVKSFLQKPVMQVQEEYRANYDEQQQMEEFDLLRRGHPSYGALLCFGLRPSRQITGAYTRCIYWKDPRRELGWWDEKEYRGCLLQQFKKARAFLIQHLDDQVSEGDGPEYGKLYARVLEEALANALIHREYVVEPGYKPRAEGVMVEIFRDRVEISSPGGPLLNIAVLQRADEQHPGSHPRNPQIMRIFYLAGHVDRKGTGIERMHRWMREAGLPKPDMELNEQTQTFAVTLHRQVVTEPENDEAAIGASLLTLSGVKEGKKSPTLRVGKEIAPRGLSQIYYLAQIILSLVLSVALIGGLGVGAFYVARWSSVSAAFVPASVTIEIASDLPTSGVDTTIGLPVQNGVQMAIDDANNNQLLPGYTFKLFPYNDVGRDSRHDPVVGASNVNKASADPLVAGIVGPYNSAIAEAELPIANQAPIALVSPSTTYPCLTKSESADSDCSGSNNILAQMRPTGRLTYFRLATTDDREGKAAADYFFTVQHHHKVLLLKDDSDLYSLGLAEAFQKEWTRLRGPLVPLGLPENANSAQDYQDTLQIVTSLQPDLIYFAGNDPNGVYLLQALSRIPQLKSVTFVGASGIMDSSFLQAAAQLRPSAAIYVSSPIQDPAQSGQAVGIDFESNYIANGYSNYRPYAASAYACTMMLIQAIKTAIQKGTSTPHGTQDQAGARQFRLAILQVLAHLRYTGPTGAQSFDANGDTTNHAITFYQLDLSNGQADWKWLQQVNA